MSRLWRVHRGASNRAAAPLGPIALWTRLGLLPLQERCFLLLVLACAALPTAALIVDASGATLLGSIGRDPLFVSAAAVVSVVAGLIALEFPRSPSISAYASQLRARLQQAQAHYDAALRRFQEEQHREQDRTSQ